MEIKSVSHIGICVSDSDRSLNFYCDILGFKKLFNTTLNDELTAKINQLTNLELEVSMIEKDGFIIELLCFRKPDFTNSPLPHPMNTTGFTHISMKVDNVKDYIQYLEDKNVEVLKESHTVHTLLKIELVFFLDPDGNRLEITETIE